MTRRIDWPAVFGWTAIALAVLVFGLMIFLLGKVLEEDDGTPVTVDGRPMVCQDGDPVAP